MKVLLTGGSGLVGRNLIETRPDKITLLAPQHNDLNLLNVNQVDTYLRKEKPDLIIHAAGTVGGIEANIKYPVRFLTENTLMANNLIVTARENDIKYVLNLGSSCMYPRNATNPLTEEQILKGELEPTNEGYAIAKIYAQRLCSYINKEEKNSNYKTLLPCNLYGRWDKFDPQWGHMLPSVIHKIHHAKSNNLPNVTIWGDGSARREFMYAADLANFIWHATAKIDDIPELMNVGLGFDYSILEYYQTIAKVVGYKGEFEFDLSKPSGMKQKLVDISIQKKLGWTPKYSLEEGIEATYNFYKQKYF